jgi:transposase InsO family protein
MAKGFLYLVVVMDWVSRAVLAWRLSNTLGAEFCVEALEEALAQYGRPEKAGIVEPRLPHAAANLPRRPADMWTIGFADRRRFPRFPSKLGKRGNARLRPHIHRHHSQQRTDIDEVKSRLVGLASARPANGADIETRRATP